jgi:nicotinate-nucleotide--dimethylbenzimidazole phosphoribosyltransferase
MQMVGAMLKQRQNGYFDGFISSVAFLIAFKKKPSIIKNAIFLPFISRARTIKY